MKLKIKKLHPDAKLPSYAHEGDAGMDIYSNEDKIIKAGERETISTGISMEVEKGYVALVWDKSGMASKHGVKTMAGVIDSGYRGEIRIVLLNTSNQPYQIRKHDKIVQILIQPIVRGIIEEVADLIDSSRGSSGFGSTGR